MKRLAFKRGSVAILRDYIKPRDAGTHHQIRGRPPEIVAAELDAGPLHDPLNRLLRVVNVRPGFAGAGGNVAANLVHS